MEDHKEKSMRVQQKNTGLVYIIVIIFITLGVTAFFLYTNMKHVKFLESQKAVLIDRLGEELLLKQQLQKKNDSIVEFWNTYEPVPLTDEGNP
jgi:hypothetical protein